MYSLENIQSTYGVVVNHPTIPQRRLGGYVGYVFILPRICFVICPKSFCIRDIKEIPILFGPRCHQKSSPPTV